MLQFQETLRIRFVQIQKNLLVKLRKENFIGQFVTCQNLVTVEHLANAKLFKDGNNKLYLKGLYKGCAGFGTRTADSGKLHCK